MKNFKYSSDNKRYHTINYFLQNKFGCKVAKISINLGLNCPNMKNGYGCIYCKNNSGNFGGDKTKSIEEQYNDIVAIMNKKWKNLKYIIYFQAGTNTNASLDFIKNACESALKLPNVVGISIATRPDSISDECLEYLTNLNKRTFLTIELGLQSMHNDTLKLINRGHNLECFDNMIKKLKANKIFVAVHIINGLPYENKEMMLKTITHLNNLQIDEVKIHMLFVENDTEIAKMDFSILTKEEYINIVISQLELLNSKIVIGRITGDPKKEDLIKPKWLLKKFCILNDIDKEMVKRNTYQGIKVKNES